MDKSMKILIVDDFSTMRKIERKILNELGFENVAEADDGSTALPLLENGDFDFVITDWYMQDMQGYDLLVAIRQNPKLSRIPVMMVTAKVEQEELVKAAKAGLNGFIVKPFTAEALQAKMQRIFERIGK
ncbi:MAG: response regulator [Ruminobacter sp.]|jgi:two-component system chemotaxis response regulator CheY|uniref:Two-component system, chemotaxis family, response regulator CheY n=1 Tax=Ruminobacter amylophilus TaxID=867 RepID=A0A662ZHF8_9GAMM|nr:MULTISPECIES: response regulator [Ruminobacter]MBQ3775778.1 response regulator [Ruminobacter sp.]SFP28267.1 two-component system, chemotaxis family, response regulator CheY [Ruminobacter amylophilus]